MIRHFFLCHASGEIPAPWQRAFPAGQPLLNEAIQDHASHAAYTDLVWLRLSPGWAERLQTLRRAHPRCIVVAMSTQTTAAEAACVLDAGARGYCHFFAVAEQLREMALVLAHGGWWIGPELMSSLVRATARLPQLHGGSDECVRLSEREEQVARSVAAGLSNKEVATRLNITERTVKAHLGAVFEKLGVRDRLQLALRFARETAETTQT